MKAPDIPEPAPIVAALAKWADFAEKCAQKDSRADLPARRLRHAAEQALIGISALEAIANGDTAA